MPNTFGRFSGGPLKVLSHYTVVGMVLSCVVALIEDHEGNLVQTRVSVPGPKEVTSNTVIGDGIAA